MDAAEYKHIVLGLIFLKYISDAFNDLYNKLKAGKGEFEAQTRKTPTNTSPTISFSCLKRPAGNICRTGRKNRKSAS